jgi:hypothetical protein
MNDEQLRREMMKRAVAAQAMTDQTIAMARDWMRGADEQDICAVIDAIVTKPNDRPSMALHMFASIGFGLVLDAWTQEVLND